MPKDDDEERVSLAGLDPEEALRALMAVDLTHINAEQMSEKYCVDGLALRNLLRAHPELVPDHQWHEHYRIDAETEARIVAHPEFQGLPKR
jgi:hypothetical protein